MQVKRAAAYGTVVIYEGERFEDAKKQLDSFVGHNVIAVYFDVLGKPKNEVEGERVVEQIKQYATKLFPHLEAEDINCTFSID